MTDFLKVLSEEKRYSPLTAATCDSGLNLAKGILESFAGDLGEEQLQKQKELRKKRKRGEKETGEGQTLKIRKLHTDGFEVGQVWEQARRVIEALVEDAQAACEELGVDLEEDDARGDINGGHELASSDEEGVDYEIESEGSEDELREEDVEIDEDFGEENREMSGEEDGEYSGD